MLELQEWIENELPSDGEWFHDGCDTFIKSAKTMLNSGMSKSDIKEILRDLYSATAEEFGA